MRTLWVCQVSGGSFQFTATKPGFTPLGLEEAHRDLRISPAEFDEVAAELGRTLDFFKVPKREKAEVLAALAAHKDEVTSRKLEMRMIHAPFEYSLLSCKSVLGPPGADLRSQRNWRLVSPHVVATREVYIWYMQVSNH